MPIIKATRGALRCLKECAPIWTTSTRWAPPSDKEKRRMEKTKEELTALQAKLDQGVFDNGTLNDVIDFIAQIRPMINAWGRAIEK